MAKLFCPSYVVIGENATRGIEIDCDRWVRKVRGSLTVISEHEWNYVFVFVCVRVVLLVESDIFALGLGTLKNNQVVCRCTDVDVE